MVYLVDPSKATGRNVVDTDLSKVCGVHTNRCPYYITLC